MEAESAKQPSAERSQFSSRHLPVQRQCAWSYSAGRVVAHLEVHVVRGWVTPDVQRPRGRRRIASDSGRVSVRHECNYVGRSYSRSGDGHGGRASARADRRCAHRSRARGNHTADCVACIARIGKDTSTAGVCTNNCRCRAARSNPGSVVGIGGLRRTSGRYCNRLRAGYCPCRGIPIIQMRLRTNRCGCCCQRNHAAGLSADRAGAAAGGGQPGQSPDGGRRRLSGPSLLPCNTLDIQIPLVF